MQLPQSSHLDRHPSAGPDQHYHATRGLGQGSEAESSGVTLDVLEQPAQGPEDGFIHSRPGQLLYKAVDPRNLRSYALKEIDLGLLAAGKFWRHRLGVGSSKNLMRWPLPAVSQAESWIVSIRSEAFRI